MSLVDSSHVQPARSRHGAHYYTAVRKSDGKHYPGMTMYPTEGFRRRCPRCKKITYKIDCGRIKDDAKKCLYCEEDLTSIDFEVVEEHK